MNEFECDINEDSFYVINKKKSEQKKEIEEKYKKEIIPLSIIEVMSLIIVVFIFGLIGMLVHQSISKNSEENINNEKVLIKEDLIMLLSNKGCLVPGDISIFKGVNERAVVKLNNDCMFAIENRMSSKKYLWINDFVKYSVINENNVIDIKMENIEKN